MSTLLLLAALFSLCVGTSLNLNKTENNNIADISKRYLGKIHSKNVGNLTCFLFKRKWVYLGPNAKFIPCPSSALESQSDTIGSGKKDLKRLASAQIPSKTRNRRTVDDVFKSSATSQRSFEKSSKFEKKIADFNVSEDSVKAAETIGNEQSLSEERQEANTTIENTDIATGDFIAQEISKSGLDKNNETDDDTINSTSNFTWACKNDSSFNDLLEVSYGFVRFVWTKLSYHQAELHCRSTCMTLMRTRDSLPYDIQYLLDSIGDDVVIWSGDYANSNISSQVYNNTNDDLTNENNITIAERDDLSQQEICRAIGKANAGQWFPLNCSLYASFVCELDDVLDRDKMPTPKQLPERKNLHMADGDTFQPEAQVLQDQAIQSYAQKVLSQRPSPLQHQPRQNQDPQQPAIENRSAVRQKSQIQQKGQITSQDKLQNQMQINTQGQFSSEIQISTKIPFSSQGLPQADSDILAQRESSAQGQILAKSKQPAEDPDPVQSDNQGQLPIQGQLPAEDSILVHDDNQAQEKESELPEKKPYAKPKMSRKKTDKLKPNAIFKPL